MDENDIKLTDIQCLLCNCMTIKSYLKRHLRYNHLIVTEKYVEKTYQWHFLMQRDSSCQTESIRLDSSFPSHLTKINSGHADATSPSCAMEEPAEEEADDSAICPVCGVMMDECTAMIACDNCDRWFHWACVGLAEPPGNNSDWLCQKCSPSLPIARKSLPDPNCTEQEDARSEHFSNSSEIRITNVMSKLDALSDRNGCVDNADNEEVENTSAIIEQEDSMVVYEDANDQQVNGQGDQSDTNVDPLDACPSNSRDVSIPKTNGRRRSKSRTGTSSIDICIFCGYGNILPDDLELDELFKLRNCFAHYHCLLFASCLDKKGKYNQGIRGYLYEDIIDEYKRATKVTCSYCNETHATVSCVFSTCTKIYHLPCGIVNGTINELYGEHDSYCSEHRDMRLHFNRDGKFALTNIGIIPEIKSECNRYSPAKIRKMKTRREDSNSSSHKPIPKDSSEDDWVSLDDSDNCSPHLANAFKMGHGKKRVNSQANGENPKKACRGRPRLPPSSFMKNLNKPPKRDTSAQRSSPVRSPSRRPRRVTRPVVHDIYKSARDELEEMLAKKRDQRNSSSFLDGDDVENLSMREDRNAESSRGIPRSSSRADDGQRNGRASFTLDRNISGHSKPKKRASTSFRCEPANTDSAQVSGQSGVESNEDVPLSDRLMNAHRKSANLTGKCLRFACPKCSYGHSVWGKVKLHIREAHPGEYLQPKRQKMAIYLKSASQPNSHSSSGEEGLADKKKFPPSDQDGNETRGTKNVVTGDSFIEDHPSNEPKGKGKGKNRRTLASYGSVKPEDEKNPCNRDSVATKSSDSESTESSEEIKERSSYSKEALSTKQRKSKSTVASSSQAASSSTQNQPTSNQDSACSTSNAVIPETAMCIVKQTSPKCLIKNETELSSN